MDERSEGRGGGVRGEERGTLSSVKEAETDRSVRERLVQWHLWRSLGESCATITLSVGILQSRDDGISGGRLDRCGVDEPGDAALRLPLRHDTVSLSSVSVVPIVCDVDHL
jgi:hypothetical protein